MILRTSQTAFLDGFEHCGLRCRPLRRLQLKNRLFERRTWQILQAVLCPGVRRRNSHEDQSKDCYPPAHTDAHATAVLDAGTMVPTQFFAVPIPFATFARRELKERIAALAAQLKRDER